MKSGAAHLSSKSDIGLFRRRARAMKRSTWETRIPARSLAAHLAWQIVELSAHISALSNCMENHILLKAHSTASRPPGSNQYFGHAFLFAFNLIVIYVS